MGQKLEVCYWGSSTSSLEFIKEQMSGSQASFDWVVIPEELDSNEAATHFKKYPVGLIQGANCMQAGQFVNHRSVGGHFLNYFDLIINRSGTLWGEAVYSHSFYDSLLGAFKNQNFKGPVIFLGDNPRALPVFETLARFGFRDFDFLTLSSESKPFEHIKNNTKSLFDTTVSEVNSASFIRSQKEYSLCFVAFDQFLPQTLEDMSYFHFLSTKSIVFDLSGCSNFFFKEVQALGVDVVDFKHLEASFVSHIKTRFESLAKELS